jgi:hypothetical protein
MGELFYTNLRNIGGTDVEHVLNTAHVRPPEFSGTLHSNFATADTLHREGFLGQLPSLRGPLDSVQEVTMLFWAEIV